MNSNEAIRLIPEPKPPQRDDRIEQAIDLAMMLPEGHQARADLLTAAAKAWIETMKPPIYLIAPEVGALTSDMLRSQEVDRRPESA